MKFSFSGYEIIFEIIFPTNRAMTGESAQALFLSFSKPVFLEGLVCLIVISRFLDDKRNVYTTAAIGVDGAFIESGFNRTENFLTLSVGEGVEGFDTAVGQIVLENKTAHVDAPARRGVVHRISLDKTKIVKIILQDVQNLFFTF